MIHTRSLVDRLTTIESIALIPRVTSTNLVARRVVNECIENELSLPQAIIIAREQLAGIGRNQRAWTSPAGKGIYATILVTRSVSEIGLIPLLMANIVASYLSEVFAIDARIKWPNDILAGGKKIAGILIEARIQEDRAFLIVGVGVNVEPIGDAQPGSVSIIELSPRDTRGLEAATLSFIEHVDERLSQTIDSDGVLSEWRARTIHRNGDRMSCVIGDSTISGTWGGIDDQGRALLQSGAETIAVSAGDLILA